MSVNYDLLQVLCSDMIAIGLIVGMLYVTKDRLHGSRKEIFYEKIILYSVVVNAFADILTRAFDGVPGKTACIIVYVTNYIIFLCGFLTAPSVLFLILQHIYQTIFHRFRIFIHTMQILGVILIGINFLHPFIFCIDETNCYHALSWYSLYPAIAFLPTIVVLIASTREKLKIGTLEFFHPVLFVTPIFIGFVMQVIFPRVSMIIPGTAVGCVFMLYNLQSETIYRDQLTGLYNRFYIEQLGVGFFRKYRKEKVTAFMMDLNHFKAINDEFGHAEGDVALIAMGNILAYAAAGKGRAIRYAGDEFIIFLFSQEEEEIKEFTENLQHSISDYNQTAGKPYALSVSIGYSKYDMQNQSFDDLMNIIDAKMYANKKKYYELHPEQSRRRRPEASK